MRLNDVQLRKLHKRFGLLDFDGNGYIELADYRNLGRRFQPAFGLSPDSPAAKAAVDTYTELFRRLHRAGDTDGDGRIDEEEFVASMARGLIERPDGFDRGMVPVLEVIMDVCDRDGDAEISRDEFARLLRVYATPEPDIGLALKNLAWDLPGGMSRTAFIRATREFYCSPDPAAPGNWFFGSF